MSQIDFPRFNCKFLLKRYSSFDIISNGALGEIKKIDMSHIID